MSLDDRLIGTVTSKIYEIESDAKLWQSTIILQLTKTSKQAILTDLLEIIDPDEPVDMEDIERNGCYSETWEAYNINQLRQELRDKVRKYCE